MMTVGVGVPGTEGEYCRRPKGGEVTTTGMFREVFLQEEAVTWAMKAGKSVEKGAGEKSMAGAVGCREVGKPAGGASVSLRDSLPLSEGSRRRSRGCEHLGGAR